MPYKFVLIGFTVVILIIVTLLNSNPARADSPPNDAASNFNPRNLGRSLETMARSSWDFFGSVGDIVTQAGESSPNCLGFLTCLVLPLACMGIWAVRNFGQILAMMSLQDFVHWLLWNQRQVTPK